MQYSAMAQDTQEYQKLKTAADSLAGIREFSKSEAMYLKA